MMELIWHKLWQS